MQTNERLAQTYQFSDELVEAALSQSMHYLHGYFSVYTPAMESACPVRRGLLLLTILSFSLKVITQDYAIEYLTIREQLALFDVTVPSVTNSPPHDGTQTDNETALNLGLKAYDPSKPQDATMMDHECAELIKDSLLASDADLLYARM